MWGKKAKYWKKLGEIELVKGNKKRESKEGRKEGKSNEANETWN